MTEPGGEEKNESGKKGESKTSLVTKSEARDLEVG